MGTKIKSRGIDFGTGTDQVNARLIPAHFTPTTYTPDDIAAEGNDKISAHLKGIDDYLSTVSGGAPFATQVEVDAGTEPAKTISPLTYQQGITNRIATQAEAEAGTDTQKLMTPERVAQAISALGQNLTLATQAEAEAGTDNTKYMTPLRVAQAIAAQGGGGSPYPDHTLVPTTNIVLTSSDQGWILPGANGITITLPSNPAVGETYKFIHGGFDCTIDANGVTIINYPNNTLALRAGMIVHFLAGSYLGNPIWMISYPEMSKAWSADVRYIAGDVVSYNGNVYIAKATTTGDQPDISPSVWVNPSSGGGGGKTVTAIQTANGYTSANNQIVRLDSTGGSFSTSLPASPSDGDEIEYVDVGGAAATNPVTINRNGNLINGLASDLSFDVNWSRIVLIFSTSQGWSVQ